jgi:hypothetical protein
MTIIGPKTNRKAQNKSDWSPIPERTNRDITPAGTKNTHLLSVNSSTNLIADQTPLKKRTILTRIISLVFTGYTSLRPGRCPGARAGEVLSISNA